jgi:molybdenum cofactor biosynthesis enzyme MoaA
VNLNEIMLRRIEEQAQTRQRVPDPDEAEERWCRRGHPMTYRWHKERREPFCPECHRATNTAAQKRRRDREAAQRAGLAPAFEGA